MNYKSKMIPIMVLMLLSGFIVSETGELYAQSTKIICPQCGKENDAGAKFCWNDGFNLSNVQIQKKTVKLVAPKPPISLPKIQPEPAAQIEEQFVGMSNAEMKLLLIDLTARLEAANIRKVRNANYISDLTRTEFRILLENTLRNQNIVRTKVVTKQESGFGSFLKAIGGVTLALFAIGILAAA